MTDLFVSLDIRRELLIPKRGTGFGIVGELAAWMAVPKTAMD